MENPKFFTWRPFQQAPTPQQGPRARGQGCLAAHYRALVLTLCTLTVLNGIESPRERKRIRRSKHPFKVCLSEIFFLKTHSAFHSKNPSSADMEDGGHTFRPLPQNILVYSPPSLVTGRFSSFKNESLRVIMIIKSNTVSYQGCIGVSVVSNELGARRGPQCPTVCVLAGSEQLEQVEVTADPE